MVITAQTIVEENANEALVELLCQTPYTKIGPRRKHSVLVENGIVTREEAGSLRQLR